MFCLPRNFNGGFSGFTENISGQYCLLFSALLNIFKEELFFLKAVSWLFSRSPISLYPIWEVVHASISVDLDRPPGTSALQADPDSLQGGYEVSETQPHVQCLLSSVTASDLRRTSLEKLGRVWARKGNGQSLGQGAGGVTGTRREVGCAPRWRHNHCPKCGCKGHVFGLRERRFLKGAFLSVYP